MGRLAAGLGTGRKAALLAAKLRVEAVKSQNKKEQNARTVKAQRKAPQFQKQQNEDTILECKLKRPWRTRKKKTTWRDSPICLLNVDYKWFTKVLTLRLTPFADKLINTNQTAFTRKIYFRWGYSPT